MKSYLDGLHIGSIQIFIKAAELQSFSHAAEFLGVTSATVSRSIARLEERLQVKLFARSTRKIKLTVNGQIYFEQCRKAFQYLLDAEHGLNRDPMAPVGHVRISAPTTYAHFRLLPIIAKFQQTYSNITIEMNISNRNIHFIDEGYDLAIRMGTPQDTRMIARRLEDAALGVYGSQDYLNRCGTPQSPNDLKHHNCIQFIRPSTGRPIPWMFYRNNIKTEDVVRGSISFSDDVLGCIGYANSGGGLVQTYDFIAKSMQYTDLVEVLALYRGTTRPFYLLYPDNKHLSVSVRLMIDFILREIQNINR